MRRSVWRLGVPAAVAASVAVSVGFGLVSSVAWYGLLGIGGRKDGGVENVLRAGDAVGRGFSPTRG
jgi:hypothetical protein